MLQEQEIKLLKIPSDVIKTSEKKKNTYGHHRKHSKFFKSELKLYSILHNADFNSVGKQYVLVTAPWVDFLFATVLLIFVWLWPKLPVKGS